MLSFANPDACTNDQDLEETDNSRHFHTPEMTIGVEYEADGISEANVRTWFDDASYGTVEIERAPFEQKTHEVK